MFVSVSRSRPWNSYHKSDVCPQAIVQPSSTDEVAAIVKLCHTHRVPIVAFGGGTSLEGQTLTNTGTRLLSIETSTLTLIFILTLTPIPITPPPPTPPALCYYLVVMNDEGESGHAPISLDFAKMQNVISLHETDLDVTVQVSDVNVDSDFRIRSTPVAAP